MPFSYKPLWKLLIDRDMSKKEFDPKNFDWKNAKISFMGKEIGEIKKVYWGIKTVIIPSVLLIAPLILDKTKRN